MRIIESQPADSGEAFYGIVGAVPRSGVFTAPGTALSLHQLIEAAGGLEPHAKLSLPVIRQGAPRFRIHYDPAQPREADLLLPGDVVLVGSTLSGPAAALDSSGTVPVICLGLLNRPVALPLDPTIQTVNQLTHKLQQSSQAALAARMFAPPSTGVSGILVPGAVIVFDSATIDRGPLLEAGALPEAIPLSPVQQTASAAPAIPPSPLTPEKPLPSMNLPPQWEDAPEVPLPLPPIHAPMISGAESLATPQPLLSEMPPPSPPLAADVAAATPEIKSAALPTVEVSPAPAISKQTEISQIQISKLPLPSQAAISSRTDGRLVEFDRILEEATASAARPTAPLPSSPSRLTPLAIGMSLLTLVFAGLLLVWSRISLPAPIVTPEPVAMPVPVAEPVMTAALAEETAVPRPGIQEILTGQVPLIEERIAIPAHWPLHGKVIGHRRFILNAAHATLAGPHFARQESRRPTETIGAVVGRRDERKLRQSLRDALQTAEFPEKGLGETDILTKSSPPYPLPLAESQSAPPEMPAISYPEISQPLPRTTVSSGQGPAAAHTASAGFDIVQPHQNLKQTAAMSPLERALRTLASETSE
jgi:hypothetical protein